MASRKGKQIEGQMCLEMYLSPSRYIVQANALVAGKQTLSINAAKLLRAAIVQIEKDDEELKPYVLSPSELANLLQITKDNIYRVIDGITDELMHSYAEARVTDGKKVKFKKINWVSFCEYDSDYGVAIKLNADMKPFLLGLKEHYTQYQLENILSMKSIYGLRIFELLQERIMTKMMPRDGLDIEISMEQLRQSLDLEDKYERWSQFQVRVLDKAVEEIEKSTSYTLSYTPRKTGKAITHIVFHINVAYHTW